MVHKCHLGFCPTLLTNKIESNPSRILSLETATNWSVNLVKGWAAELRLIMDRLGVRRLGSLVSRRDLLVADGLPSDDVEILGVENC